jgi:YHS domain-containing protein
MGQSRVEKFLPDFPHSNLPQYIYIFTYFFDSQNGAELFKKNSSTAFKYIYIGLDYYTKKIKKRTTSRAWP